MIFLMIMALNDLCCSFASDCVSLAYQRVQKVECTSPRPVLVLGPLTDPVKEMLVKESPGKFCRCVLGEFIQMFFSYKNQWNQLCIFIIKWYFCIGNTILELNSGSLYCKSGNDYSKLYSMIPSLHNFEENVVFFTLFLFLSCLQRWWRHPSKPLSGALKTASLSTTSAGVAILTWPLLLL